MIHYLRYSKTQPIMHSGIWRGMMTISYCMNDYFYALKLTLVTNSFGVQLICNVLYFNSMKGYICVSIYTPLFLNGSAIHVFKVLTYPMTQVLNDDCKYIYFSHIGYIFPKINLQYFLFLRAHYLNLSLFFGHAITRIKRTIECYIMVYLF